MVARRLCGVTGFFFETVTLGTWFSGFFETVTSYIDDEDSPFSIDWSIPFLRTINPEIALRVNLATAPF